MDFFIIWTVVAMSIGVVIGMNVVIVIERIVRWATRNYNFNVG